MLERVLVALLADGHVLLEGVPGLAKTLTVKTLAQVMGGTFSRVQFTPDLVPADLVGTRVWRPDTGSFDTELGPVFGNLLLADEINRAPAKVQSALLEVMQEQQVTIGGQTFPVPSPFLVLATQNPIESEGTYPLPEAQVDRFLLKILVDYPSVEDESAVVSRVLAGEPEVRRVLETDTLMRHRETVRAVAVERRDTAYAVVARRRDAPPGRLRPRGPREPHRGRREPARADRPRAVRPGARAAARPRLRHLARHPRRRAGRAAPPARPELRGARRRRHAGPDRRPRARRRRGARDAPRERRVSTALVSPPGRQGPGPMPAAAVAALDLALVRRTGGRLPGSHRGIGVGVGTELAQLRPYQVGDDVRMIDPAASARTGVPHVRQHVPERALTTWVVVDLSPSMAFGTTGRLKSDVAEGVTKVVARLSARRGGRVGVVAAGAPHPIVLPPAGGRRALGAIDRHARRRASRPTARPSERLSEALIRVRGLARQPGLVVVASDFRDERPWLRAMRLLVASGQQVVAVEILDPRELELPDGGVLSLVDPETGELVEVDTRSNRLRQDFAGAEARRREQLAADLRRIGARHAVVRTDRDWLRDLGSHLA